MEKKLKKIKKIEKKLKKNLLEKFVGKICWKNTKICRKKNKKK
jgi:hypothetical protein